MPVIKSGDKLHPALWEIASSHHPLLKFSANITTPLRAYVATVPPPATKIVVIPSTEISSKKQDLQVEELLANISISSTVPFLGNVSEELIANATEEAKAILKTVKDVTMPNIIHGEDVVKIQQTWWEWLKENFEKIV